MKKAQETALVWWVIIFALALFWASILFVLWLRLADAQPYLVCDPPTTGGPVEYYTLSGLPWLTGQYLPQLDGSMRVDMSATPEGTEYTVRATACNVWGCSIESDPFTFTRSALLAPSIPGLVP